MREEQLARHWRIMLLLEQRRAGISVEELADDLACSERTIYRDLSALQRAGFPVTTEKENGSTRYRFVDGYRGRVSLEASNDELLALYFSRGLLKIMEGTVFESSLASLIRKISRRLPAENLAYFNELSGSIAVGGKACRNYGAKEAVIMEVLNAASSRRVLEIRYFSASSGRVMDRKVDPYKLWCANEALYLIGWCHRNKMVRTFLVDRIERAKMRDEHFTVSETFDFSEYFNNSFRVMKDGRRTRVVIRFRPEVAYAFKEKKWHPTQEVEIEKDGSALVTIEAEGLDELRSWVLSWGDKAQVVEPADFRKKIIAEIKSIAKSYGPETADSRPGKASKKPRKKARSG